MLSRLKRFFARPGDGPHAPWRVFWVALAVRLLYMTLAHTYKFRQVDQHFQFGWEAGRIAQALVTGFGYADPFSNPVLQHSGPTAWLPPLYPLLVAAVFRIFGIYTYASAWVLLAINCVLSAFTTRWIWEIGTRVFPANIHGRTCALWAAWLWALYPAAMQYAVRWVWEMTLTTFLFTWVFALTLRLGALPVVSGGLDGNPREAVQRRQQGLWLLFGLLWGLIGLSNSSLLVFLPFCALWMLVRTRRTMARTARGLILSTLLFLLCIAPWTLRNWQVFHAFVPLRGNLGVEMYLGNGPGSTGLIMAFDHPGLSHRELFQYRDLGEVRYAAERGRLARDFIDAHPAHFLAITLRRVLFFWDSVPHPIDEPWYVEYGRTLNYGVVSLSGLLGLGLALARRVPGAWLFAGAFLLLPLPYYLITVHARFRHPLEPLICVLAVYLFQSAERRKTTADETDKGRMIAIEG